MIKHNGFDPTSQHKQHYTIVCFISTAGPEKFSEDNNLHQLHYYWQRDNQHQQELKFELIYITL